MPTPRIDWTPFLVLAFLLAFIAAQHWLLCLAVLLVWERLLQIWQPRLKRARDIQVRAGAWSRD